MPVTGVDPTMDANKRKDLYNMVTIKNPLTEDFVFGYDNKGKKLTIFSPDGKREIIDNPDYNIKGNYVIGAGETRNFPKFIAEKAMKHLIDKILMDRDSEGKLLLNQKERDEIAKTILVGEEKFDRPVLPTDQEVIEMMNKESDLSRALEASKQQPKEEVAIEQDIPTTTEYPDSTASSSTGTNLPSREEMLKYAKGSLMINPETVIKAPGPNKDKTIAQVWDSMTDQQLYDELQISEGDIDG